MEPPPSAASRNGVALVAISPPSDLVLDVAGAADPAALRAATQRLAKLAADPTLDASQFATSLQRAASASTMPASTPTLLPEGNALLSHRPLTHAAPSTYTKFEAVLLQNFVESMLPKDDDSFGDKESAGVYRSMMAEQLANQIANAGGIGIAKAIEAAHPAPHGATKAKQT